MNYYQYKSRLYYLQNMKPYELLQELLAIIHNDRGEGVSEHGCAKMVLEAELKWAALQSRNDPTSDSLSGG